MLRIDGLELVESHIRCEKDPSERFYQLAVVGAESTDIFGRKKVKTHSLLDMLNEFQKVGSTYTAPYFGYHISTKPMTWEQATDLNICKTMGLPTEVDVYHRYSDLTGYLWTDVIVEDEDGHNVYEEILGEYTKIEKQGKKAYITMLLKDMKE